MLKHLGVLLLLGHTAAVAQPLTVGPVSHEELSAVVGTIAGKMGLDQSMAAEPNSYATWQPGVVLNQDGFPLPGGAYGWNIQPFSSTFSVFRQVAPTSTTAGVPSAIYGHTNAASGKSGAVGVFGMASTGAKSRVW